MELIFRSLTELGRIEAVCREDLFVFCGSLAARTAQVLCSSLEQAVFHPAFVSVLAMGTPPQTGIGE